jgi:hypothetical protein
MKLQCRLLCTIFCYINDSGLFRGILVLGPPPHMGILTSFKLEIRPSVAPEAMRLDYME